MKINKNSIKILMIFILIIIISISIIYSLYKRLNNKLILSGTIESTEIDINSEVTGKVLSLVKDEGDLLIKNDVIVIIDSSMQELIVKQQEANLDNIITYYNYWLDTYKRIKSTYESGNISKQDYLDTKLKMDSGKEQVLQAQASLEQARLVLSKFQINSPIKGTYLSRNVNINDIVNIGTNIATVSDLTDLWIKVFIPQKYLGKIKLNQEIILKAIALENKILKGRMIYISSESEFTPKNIETNEEKENTVFKIKIKILNYIDELKPGMTVDAIIPIK